MLPSRIKSLLLLFVLVCTGCDLPPDEVESMREQLQSKLSKGQVYVTHSSSELSYMIRNSQFNKAGEAARDQLIQDLEPQAIDFLKKYPDYKHLRIYFLGQGTAGINAPYLCQKTTGSCRKSIAQKS